MLFLVGLFNAIAIGPGFLPVALVWASWDCISLTFTVDNWYKSAARWYALRWRLCSNRLAIQVGRTSPTQALEQIALKPGGPFVQELRQVSTDNFNGHTLTEALDGFAQRAAGIDEVRRFCRSAERAQQLAVRLPRR